MQSPSAPGQAPTSRPSGPAPAAPARLPGAAVLTHHWLVRRRGGEKVLEALAELLPGADVFTLVCDPAAAAEVLPGRRVFASPLGRLPGAARHYPKLLPLLPAAAWLTRLPEADLVVCSDAAIAKAMRARRRSRVVCYCHSPMRYVWEPEISRQYAATLPRMLRPLWPAVCAWVRACDRAAARRVDVFVANSAVVAARIARCYGREARVVYPPVDVPESPPASSERESFYLCVGHHVAYKRLDLAVEACRLLGRSLVVIGDGPEVARLQLQMQAPEGRAAGAARRETPERVTLLGHQPDETVAQYLARARALLFPGEEDFGLVPVEAMARGCPVVAYGRGGATESVIDGVTGVLFEPQTAESLAEAMRRAESLRFDPHAMWSAMRRFSRRRFIAEMAGILGG